MALSKLFTSTSTDKLSVSIPKSNRKSKSVSQSMEIDIQFESETNSLVFANLIDFSLCDETISDNISHLLSIGWILPTMNDTDNRYRCKIHEYVTCSTLTEALQYTFDSFLILKTKQQNNKYQQQQEEAPLIVFKLYDNNYSDDFEINKNKKKIKSKSMGSMSSITSSNIADKEWALKIYKILMESLTLRQKAYLFSIGSDRKNRKYKLIHEYKDCIVGTEGVEWMIIHQMAQSRNKAVELGQTMLSKGYLSHVCYNHQFEDKQLWYKFDDELIEKVKNNLDDKMNDKQFMQRQLLTQKQSKKMAVFQHYRLKKHNEIIQYLVTMTVTPDTEIELLLDIQRAFFLPTKLLNKSNMNNNNNKNKKNKNKESDKFVCKVIDNVSFSTIIEVVQFILTELWEQNYAQNIYTKLINRITLTQKAKLFSIAADRKNRTYHFKKYTDCFIASEGIEWLINAKFVKHTQQAIDLGNTFLAKKYLKHVTSNHKFKNEKLFFVFDDGAIDKQCMMEGYMKQQLLHRKLKRKQDELTCIKSSGSHISSDDTKSCDDVIIHQQHENNVTVSQFNSLSEHVIEDTVIAKLTDDEIEKNDDEHFDDSQLLRDRMTIVAEKVPEIPDDDDDDD